jgi:glucokinase
MPLRRLLEEASGLPTVVDNDANTATWAEARIGKSADYMMFLTIGTGVGGGFLLNGELYRGTTGIGAEVGHIVVDPQGRCRCSCGLNGCLEALASGTALGRYGREAAAADPTGHLATLAGQPPAVTGQIVQMAAEAGDPVARSLYARLGFWLGVGIASLVTVFDPELIVLGGGVATAGDMLLAPTRVSFEEHLFARAHRRVPPIVGATLGVEAGWAGAGLLALDLRRELRRPMLGEPASSSS